MATPQMPLANGPFLINGVNLVGCDVLEVGLRQAWPFLTLGASESRTERRLFIDTDFVVLDATGAELDRSELTRLESLIMLVIEDVRRGPAGLRIGFDNGASITISNEANTKTTGDIWWLSEPL